MNWQHLCPSAIVDSFLCKIAEPSLEGWRYYHKEKKGYYVKYEIACAIGVPRIIWISGPWKLVDDGKLTEFSGLLDQLQEGERMMGDKGYRHRDKWILCPISGEKYELPREDRARNYIVYSVRQTIERVIRRERNWGILNTEWVSSLDLHCLVVHVISKLINFFLLFHDLG